MVEDGISRRGAIVGAGVLTAAGALGIESAPVFAQSFETMREFDWSDTNIIFFAPHVRHETPYLFDTYPLKLDSTNPNIKFRDGKISEFYGIPVDTVTRLRPHPHTDDSDPYKGYENKLTESCCDKTDCGPAEVREIGKWKNEKTGTTETIYAYGIMIDGDPVFALSVPTVTSIYSKDAKMGDEPNHGCIFEGRPMCLFLSLAS